MGSKRSFNDYYDESSDEDRSVLDDNSGDDNTDEENSELPDGLEDGSEDSETGATDEDD
ncbi:unnamed protein product, partial [Didymodactylos carnosus]